MNPTQQISKEETLYPPSKGKSMDVCFWIVENGLKCRTYHMSVEDITCDKQLRQNIIRIPHFFAL